MFADAVRRGKGLLACSKTVEAYQSVFDEKLKRKFRKKGLFVYSFDPMDVSALFEII